MSGNDSYWHMVLHCRAHPTSIYQQYRGFQVDLYTTPTGTPMTYYAPGFSGVQLKQ